MKIILSPLLTDKALTISKRSDVLTINGERYDFRPMPDNSTLPASAIDCEWIDQDVRKINGDLEITIRLPFASDSPQSVRFPADIINPPDGKVVLPT
jgi:hypothetical protein